MPSPLFLALSPFTRMVPGILSRAGSMAVWNATASSVHAASNPLTREMGYRAENAARNLLPPPELARQLYHSGLLTRGGFDWIAHYQGLSTSTGILGNDFGTQAWESWIEQQKPWFGIDFTRRQRRMGLIGEQRFAELMRREGYGDPADQRAWLEEPQQLSEESVIRGWLLRIFSTPLAIELLRQLGYHPEDAARLLATARSVPSPLEALALMNRGVITGEQADEYLIMGGLTDPDDRRRFSDFQRVYPGVSSFITYSVREAWDDTVAASYGYDKEMPPQFRHFLEQLGYGWDVQTPEALANGAEPLDIAKAEWRSHWRPLGPEQIFTMRQRFRGDPNDPATWSVPGVRPFTDTDTRTWLRINDYPPGVRDWLFALSYTPMRLIDIRQAYYLRTQDEDWVAERLLDRGQSPDRITDILALYRAQRDERERAPIPALERKALRDLSNNQLAMYRDGLAPREFVVANLVTLKWKEEAAEAAVNNVDTAVALDIAKKALQRARSDLFSGRDTADSIHRRLDRIGIKDPRRSQIIAGWIAQFGEAKRQLSTEKILRLHREGLITFDEAARRLSNLQWSDTDTILQLAEVRLQQLKDQARELALIERKQSEQRKEIERQQKAIEDRKTHLERRQAALTPKATVIRWLKNRRVTYQRAAELLRLQGLPDDLIALYLSDAAPTAGSATNGQSTPTQPPPQTGPAQGSKEPPTPGPPTQSV